MPKIIKLTQGKYAIVDDEDFEYLSQFKWWSDGHGYAIRKVKNKVITMHSVLLSPPRGKEIDHINRNRSDNRKNNLRVVTRQQNLFNSNKHSDNISGFKGINRHNLGKGYWRAKIFVAGKHKHLGLFNTKEEAARIYDTAAKKHFGEFAGLNFE